MKYVLSTLVVLAATLMVRAEEPKIPVAHAAPPVASGDFATREQVEALQADITEIKSMLKKQATAQATASCPAGICPAGTTCANGTCSSPAGCQMVQFTDGTVGYMSQGGFSSGSGSCDSGSCGSSGGRGLFGRRRR